MDRHAPAAVAPLVAGYRRGYRFVRRADGAFVWVLPHAMLPTDVDCSDMSDGDFERLVGGPVPSLEVPA